VEPDSLGQAEQAIAVLREERAKSLRTLLSIPDEACATRVEFWGRKQTINQRLRAFTGHADDHFQHLHRLLQARGHQFTEAQLLMMKAHAALAEFEVLVLSLDDQEFDAPGPNEGDWSARQVLEHVIDNEREYRENILAGLAQPAPEPNATEGAGATA
jgi:Mycothiol maleylpyruvate isomerase N-terminal domain